MKATFNFCQLVDGKLQKTIITAPILQEFNGGVLVYIEGYSAAGGTKNMKAVAIENIIEIFK